MLFGIYEFVWVNKEINETNDSDSAEFDSVALHVSHLVIWSVFCVRLQVHFEAWFVSDTGPSGRL